MTRDRALTILREHEAELKAKGVAHLRLFGSVARDEATDDSDVDIIVDFEPQIEMTWSLLFGTEQDLSAILGTDVDMSREAFMKERIRNRALREAVLAF